MRNRIDLYSRVSVAIVLAMLTSQLLVQEVFLGYSPRVRTDLADRVVETSLAMVNFDNYRTMFSKNREAETAIAQSPEEALEQLAKVPYKKTLISGVYAKETGNAHLTRINVQEIDWVSVDYQKRDGTIITVEIPRGGQKPEPGLY
ncbi:MAG: hypothetical protein NUV98_00665 [Candidatus Roizmanbacteria bacterium]|nr:hypothetical protein [Candidatus Roizmanbacteria bacterium]